MSTESESGSDPPESGTLTSDSASLLVYTNVLSTSLSSATSRMLIGYIGLAFECLLSIQRNDGRTVAAILPFASCLNSRKEKSSAQSRPFAFAGRTMAVALKGPRGWYAFSSRNPKERFKH